MRVAIYTRVSQDSSGRGRSVEEQEQECRDWVQRAGWSLADGRTWSDNDVSASRFGTRPRPQWQNLMERLEQGGADVLMVWEPSRATRDRKVWAALAAVCEEQHVRFACNGKIYDLAEPDDAFHLDLFFALAARESGATQKRVQRSTRASALAGRPHGKLPYGYTREYREGRNGPELVEQRIVEDEADVIREAARRVAGGQALYAIAQDFNVRGIPAPAGKSWHQTQIKRLCVNPSYIAKRTHKGEVVADGQWPAVLDQTTFQVCQQILGDPARRTNVGRGATHLLSGIAVCGVCSGRLRVQKNRSHLAYLCTTNFCVSRKKENLELFVTDVIVGRLARPDIHQLLADDPDKRDAVAMATAEAASLKTRLNAFYEEAAAGELSPTGMSSIERPLLKQIQAAERRARPVNTAPVLLQVAGSDASAAWTNLTLEQKRLVISLLCEVKVLPGRRGARSFDPATVTITWR